jgi:MscS family membrane protein
MKLLLIIALQVFVALSPLDLIAAEGDSGNTSISNEIDTINPKEDKAEKDVVSLIEKIAKNPLSPPNTTSPRTTLKGFTESMNLAYQILRDAHSENQKTPGILTSESVEKKEKQAESLIKRSIKFLNFSAIPKEARGKVEQGRTLMLKEILDRIEVPPSRDIPGAKAIEKEEELYAYI